MLKKYSLYCISESKTVETDYRTALPTVCPNNNEHTIDPDSVAVVAQTAETDANITSSVDLNASEKGFRNLSGHNYFHPGLRFDIEAGKLNIFMKKFSSLVYTTGGGFCIPEFIYKSGVKTDQKPEDGDYVGFDFADIDNVLGLGKTASISKVARSSGVVTVTVAADHTFLVGEKVCVDSDDNTFDEPEATITAVTSNTFSFSQIGDDVSEKDATGTAGKVVVLCEFIKEDYVWPRKMWELLTEDAKPVPPGIYMRFKYDSKGSDNLVAYVWYNTRT